MPVKKKRASYSKTPHIAVAAQVSTLEDETEHVSSVVEHKASEPLSPAPAHSTEKLSEPASASTEYSEILAQDASEPEVAKKNTVLYRIGMGVTGIIVICSLSLYAVYLQSGKTTASAVPTAAVTPTPSTAPVDKQSITIEVLNGSGVSGKAQKTADLLRIKGYTIISTGNAKKIKVSAVQFSEHISKQAMDLLLSDLRDYGVSSISAEPFTSSVSARITLGLK